MIRISSDHITKSWAYHTTLHDLIHELYLRLWATTIIELKTKEFRSWAFDWRKLGSAITETGQTTQDISSHAGRRANRLHTYSLCFCYEAQMTQLDEEKRRRNESETDALRQIKTIKSTAQSTFVIKPLPGPERLQYQKQHEENIEIHIF